MIPLITKLDPSWRTRFRQREAILWLGPDAVEMLGDGKQAELLQAMLRRTWAAVFCDICAPLEQGNRNMQALDEELTLRFFIEDAGPERIPPNRLPVFWLRGVDGTVGPSSTEDPASLLTRMSMLQRAPHDKEVFVVGISDESGLAGLVQAAQITEAFRQVVLVGRTSLDVSQLAKVTNRLFVWDTDVESFKTVIEEAARPDETAKESTLLIRTPDGMAEVDFSQCIDPSYPITSAFESVAADEIIGERTPTVDDVKQFLANPTLSWLPYASGVPFPRHPEYERSLLKYLRRFEHEGPSLTCTAWLPAEDGSGSTTALRQLVFNVAREGFPVLLAKPETSTLDFKQLAAFLTQSASRIIDEDISPSELPWVVAFDAQHTQLMWESVKGLANGLKNLMRSVVVLAVQPVSQGRLGEAPSAQGVNRKLGDTLECSVTVDQGVMVGEHLSKFLPAAATRSESQWRWFVKDSARPGIDGSRSLFWVALHFWLLHLPGTDESLRSWLFNKLQTLVDGNSSRYRALLEIAVLGKHRLPTPLALLTESGAQSLVSDSDVLDSPVGLRRTSERGVPVYFYPHPLVAEEMLRIAESDANALAAIDMTACMNLLDLELHLLGGIVARPAAGTEACLPLMEELVTTALRVDPREAPRNYQVRDRLVEILENASPALWDSSQVFNHHVAKARRHLAMDPPDSRWTIEMRREQLTLAEQHLNDAIHNIEPPHESHRESDLNLCVSMALTCDARSRLESDDGDSEAARSFQRKSEDYYLRAQSIDADNSYVLENYARYKLRTARQMPSSQERVRLIVEAISLLDLERQADDMGHREYATAEELANAYSMLNEGDAEQELGKMAAEGSEPALVALAKLSLRRSFDEAEALEECLAQAESYLTRIPGEDRSWRSVLTLYQVVSRRSPRDFPRRLELLEELESTGAFAWPQQLRLEYAILLFQAGDIRGRGKGAEVYKALRDEMPNRSSAARVPGELKYLRDPRTDFADALKTFIIVKNVSNVGRSSYGIPDGWGHVDIVFRAYLFGRDRIDPGEELDCLVQFTNFGPQAVPVTQGDRHA